MTSLSKPIVERLVAKKLKAQRQEGIKFAIAGNAGYGKTSTVNELFGVNMDTDPVSTTTKEVHRVSMDILNVKRHESKIQDTTLIIYDLPGLGDGEDRNGDEVDSYEVYRKLLNATDIDVLLWVLRADVRAFQLEIDYISKLIEEFPQMKSRIIIGVNFVDKIEPYETWAIKHKPTFNCTKGKLRSSHKRVADRIHKKGLESRSRFPNDATGRQLFNHTIEMLLDALFLDPESSQSGA
ncbi:MAG: 50S ribosome-binding GTPase [Anaerolineaceae bacterium]|nr:50S ribosome-binding GTPase [Anaerolineaceae bacterium]